MTAEIKAALSRLDITAHQQLPFLFNMIREQPRAHWSLLLSDYVVFPLANNPDSSDIFRQVHGRSHVKTVSLTWGGHLHRSFLDHEWRDWVWPFFERDSVGDLLSRQDERTLFTVAMNMLVSPPAAARRPAVNMIPVLRSSTISSSCIRRTRSAKSLAIRSPSFSSLQDGYCPSLDTHRSVPFRSGSLLMAAVVVG